MPKPLTEARLMHMRICGEKYTLHPKNLSPITLRVTLPQKNTSPFSINVAPKVVYFQHPSFAKRRGTLHA